MRKQRPGSRILAIDLTARGFGFVVVEDGDRLVDWGLRDIREEKEQRTIEKLQDLLSLYRPSTLVLEDVDDLSSRRSPRIQRMVRLVGGFAVQAGVAPRAVAPAQVRACFARLGASTKHQIAGVMCGRFPELVSYRPPRRRLWMSEDERMAIFDAASLAATFFVWCE